MQFLDITRRTLMNCGEDLSRELELLNLLCEKSEFRSTEVQWLEESLIRNNICSASEARSLWMRDRNDGRAVCWAALIAPVWDIGEIRRAACDFGYSFAQSIMALHTDGDECFKFATEAHENGEANGTAILAYCFDRGIGCAKDKKKAEELRAICEFSLGTAVLGAKLNAASDPERMRWALCAAKKGVRVGEVLSELYTNVVRKCNNFSLRKCRHDVLFAAGEILSGSVRLYKKKIFRVSDQYSSVIPHVVQAVHFYESQCQAAKDAVTAWFIVATRLGVVKDIRVLIAKMVWQWRKTGRFPIFKKNIEEPELNWAYICNLIDGGEKITKKKEKRGKVVV